MIAGFLGPDAGDIWFDDRRMTDVPPHRRNTAMVFQSYALFPHMSVAENDVGFGCCMRKLPRMESAARVAEALELVSLTGLEDRAAGTAFRRAAAAGSWLWRAPSSRAPGHPAVRRAALQSRRQLREKVRVEDPKLQRRLRITSIYVTHDQAEALVVSDRIVAMNRGRIEQIGDPDTIYRAPDNAFVADFIGLTNIVEAHCSTTARSIRRSVACSIDGGQPLTIHACKADTAPRGHEGDGQRPGQSIVRHGAAGHLRAATSRSSRSDVNGHSLRGQLDNDLRPQEGEAITSSASTPDRIRVVG